MTVYIIQRVMRMIPLMFLLSLIAFSSSFSSPRATI